MALYHELHPPTGITHCVRSYFTHVPRHAKGKTKALPDLVVIRSNYLHIYQIRTPHGEVDDSKFAGAKLEELFSIPLAAMVESIAVLRGRSSLQKDALLLAFRDAKLSVLDWDDNTHNIHTSSLHYFEGDPSIRMGRTVFPYGPNVKADPQGRCAAVLMFNTQLALLPAMETEGLELDLMMDDPYGEGPEGAAGGPAGELVSATVGNSYVVNLAKAGMKQVRDLVFLHKYNEPVLLVLHERSPTWPGRYQDSKDTMALTALSLNVVQKQHPKIWEVAGLPSDTFKLIPVHTGGALAISQSMVMFFTQAGSLAVVVNKYALPGDLPERLEIEMEGEVLPAQVAAQHATRYCTNVHPDAAPAMARTADKSAVDLRLNLSAAQHVWVSQTTLALLLRSGQMVLVHLTVEAGFVRQMKVEPSLNAGVASCACWLHSRLLFLGSWLASSLLVQVTNPQNTKKRGASAEKGGAMTKRPRLEGQQASGLGSQDAEGEDEEREAERQQKAHGGKGDKLAFKAVDTLLGIGPVRDMTTGDPVSSAAAEWSQDSRRGPPQLIACSGQGKQGALSILRRGLVPELILEVPLPGVKGIWAVHHAEAVDSGGQLTPQGGQHHTYLLMSHPASYETKVLETGEELAEVPPDRCGFMLNSPTIAAGNVLSNTLIVQVYATGVKVLAGSEEVQELPIQDILPSMEWRPNVVIAAACIADPYVLLHFSDGSAVLLSGDEDEGCLIGEDAANQALQADINADPTIRLTAATLYHDSSGWLSKALSARAPQPAESDPLQAESAHDRLVEVEDGGLEGGQEGGLVAGEQAPPADPPGSIAEGTSTQKMLPSHQQPTGDGTGAASVKEESTASDSGAQQTASTAIFGSQIAGEQKPVLGTSEGPEPSGPSHVWADSDSPAAQVPQIADVTQDAEMEATNQLQLTVHQDNTSAPSCNVRAASPNAERKGKRQAFIVLCRENGWLQMYALPDMDLVFSYQHASDGPAVMGEGGCSPDPGGVEGGSALQTAEVCMQSFGVSNTSGIPACERPVMLLLQSDGNLLAYQAFQPPNHSLTFHRLRLDWSPHLDPTANPQQAPPHPNAVQPSTCMQRFENLGEDVPWGGIFISGSQPLWLVASRGILVSHPMEVEGPVAGFTPFHNINCPQGFITAVGGEQGGGLKICQMPIKVHLDTPWPLQRIPQHATPHRATFYPEAGLYFMLVSKDGSHKEWLEEEEGGDMHAAYSYALAKAATQAKAKEYGYEVRLVQPGQWKTVASYALGPAEDALCVKALQLKNSTSGEMQAVVAVGTSQSFGEDCPCTGRVLIFQPSKTNLGSNNEVQWTANMLYFREYRGPVTCLSSLEGYLILTIGNKLEVHQWTGSNLLRTAFFDAPMLITSLNVVKTFILFGDVHKSIYFVQYRDQGKQLILLSKDFDNADISATEFIISGQSLSFLAADEGFNMRMFKFALTDPNSWKGQKLMPVGALHIGHRVTRMVQQSMHSADSVSRLAAVFATRAGSIGCVAPLLNDTMLPLLQRVQHQMALTQAQPAGLNPAAFRRRFRHTCRGLAGGQHFGKPIAADTIIASEGLLGFQFLSYSQQATVAKACDSSREAVMTVLSQLATSSVFF